MQNFGIITWNIYFFSDCNKLSQRKALSVPGIFLDYSVEIYFWPEQNTWASAVCGGSPPVCQTETFQCDSPFDKEDEFAGSWIWNSSLQDSVCLIHRLCVGLHRMSSIRCFILLTYCSTLHYECFPLKLLSYPMTWLQLESEATLTQKLMLAWGLWWNDTWRMTVITTGLKNVWAVLDWSRGAKGDDLIGEISKV